MTKLTVKMQTLKFLIWIRFNVDFDVNFLCELFAKRRIQMTSVNTVVVVFCFTIF
jgi:hypothetical protein